MNDQWNSATISHFLFRIFRYCLPKMFRLLSVVVALVVTSHAFQLHTSRFARSTSLAMQADGLKINMKGKTVFVGGVADSTGYGWAIAKACAEAGAKVILGTWPPVLPIFQMFDFFFTTIENIIYSRN